MSYQSANMMICGMIIMNGKIANKSSCAYNASYISSYISITNTNGAGLK
jgi:hypothetical protein